MKLQAEASQRTHTSQPSQSLNEIMERSELAYEVEHGIGIEGVICDLKIRCSLQVYDGSASPSEVPCEVVTNYLGCS